MPESVFTQTMPSLLAGGVCCCAVEAGLAGVEEADEFDGVGIAAVGVGLVEAGVGACELAGAEPAGGAFSAAVSADFLERDFFVLPVSGAAVASALAVLSGDFLERDFFVVEAEESAAVELSAASAGFFDRLFFLGVASASAAAVVASAESALLFFDRLFLVPVSLVELSAVLVELSAASADFVDRLFFGLLLSAVALSASPELALFLERLFLVVEESAAAELSALFFLDLDWVLLESAESAAVCEESSALAFFLDFLVVELSV